MKYGTLIVYTNKRKMFKAAAQRRRMGYKVDVAYHPDNPREYVMIYSKK